MSERDRFVPKHPRPASEPSWDADTGVGEPPRPGNASARAALEGIGAIARQLDEHSETDRRELDRINRKLDQHGETLTTLRESAAETRATVRSIRDSIQHQQQLQLAEVQGEQTARVEKHKAERERMSGRTKVLLALIGVMSAAVTLLTTYLAK